MIVSKLRRKEKYQKVGRIGIVGQKIMYHFERALDLRLSVELKGTGTRCHTYVVHLSMLITDNFIIKICLFIQNDLKFSKYRLHFK